MNQSGHKFAHVRTAQLSWHVQICDLILALFFTEERNVSFKKFWLRAHNPSVRRVPGTSHQRPFTIQQYIQTDPQAECVQQQTIQQARSHNLLPWKCGKDLINYLTLNQWSIANAGLWYSIQCITNGIPQSCAMLFQVYFQSESFPHFHTRGASNPFRSTTTKSSLEN